MSETETVVPMDDKALFDAAISTEDPVTDAPVTDTATEQTDAGPARDEHGRFASKTEAPAQVEAATVETPPEQKAPAVEAKQEPPPGWIPAWRAREIADARVRDLQAELRKYTEKPQDPIDPYVDPEKFRDQGVQSALSPVTSQIDQLKEHYSRELATRDFGQETVSQAYDAMDQAIRSGDQQAIMVKQRMDRSPDPYREMVKWHRQTSLLTAIGDDPEKFLTGKLAEMAKDPAKREQLLAIINPAQQQQQATQQAQPTNIVKLPPSLNRQPGTAGNANAGTMSDADLYAQAIR